MSFGIKLKGEHMARMNYKKTLIFDPISGLTVVKVMNKIFASNAEADEWILNRKIYKCYKKMFKNASESQPVEALLELLSCKLRIFHPNKFRIYAFDDSLNNNMTENGKSINHEFTWYLDSKAKPSSPIASWRWTP